MNEDIKITLENLKKNGMEAHFVNTKEEALELLLSFIPKGSTVAAGGSASLKECGVLEALKSGDYNYLDRHKENITKNEAYEVLKQSLTADVYLSSTNAVTLGGELYNVDGTGNRLAALNFGPEKVIFLVGTNKIVKDLKEADIRVKTIAAPKNTVRLCKNTPCSKTGKCFAITQNINNTFNDGCQSSDRICRNYLVLGKQKDDGRVKVIICAEMLGY